MLTFMVFCRYFGFCGASDGGVSRVFWRTFLVSEEGGVIRGRFRASGR